MKKMLSMALLLALVTPQAFASKARLIALGMDEIDNEGSYYIDDSRNIFLNAANVNDYSDSIMLEWGGEGLYPGEPLTSDNTYATYDTDADPKAQGGFLKSHGNYVYGIYLGNESNTSSLLKILSTASSTSLLGKFLDTSDNQVDFFLGSNHSDIDWGLSVVYTTSEFESSNSEDQGYAVRLGAKGNDWNVFLNTSISGESEQTVENVATVAGVDVTQRFDGSLGVHLGGGLDVSDEGHVYGYVKSFKWDQYDSVGAITVNVNPPATTQFVGRGQKGTVEGSFTTYSLGYGHTVEHDAGTLFTDIHLRKREIEVEFEDVAEVDELVVPVTIGYEAAATSWLTLRGSIRHNLYGVTKNDNYDSLNPVIGGLAKGLFGADTDGKKSTVRNSTTVNAGASLTFGNLVVDGVIGTTLNSATPQARVNSSTLSLDDALARVGATYSF